MIFRIANKNSERKESGRVKLIAFTSAFCYRGESSCHATRRDHGPESDLHLHRSDVTIIVLKVTVMTPVHFGPIRMVLTFSFPHGDSCAPNVLSKRTETLGIGPSVPFAHARHMRLPRITQIGRIFSREMQIRVCAVTTEISSESVSIVDLTFGQVASL